MSAEVPLPDEARSARRQFAGGVLYGRGRRWQVIDFALCLLLPYPLALLLAVEIRDFASPSVTEFVFYSTLLVPYIGTYGARLALVIYLSTCWPCPSCSGRLSSDRVPSRNGTWVLVCTRCKVRWDSGEEFISCASRD